MRLITASLSLLFLSTSSAFTFDCKDVVREEVKWNLEKLGGQHQVSWIRHHLHIVQNTTYKIDICKALDLTDDAEKKDCNFGTRICGIEHQLDSEEKDRYIGAMPIAREFVSDGAHLEPKITRLNKDGQEGVEITLGGGALDEDKVHQKAVITFICDKEPKERRSRSLDTREDDNEVGKNDDEKEPYHKDWADARKTKDGAGGSIEFIAYRDAILELEWTTPFACEDAVSNPPKDDKEPSPDNGSDNGGSNTGGGWGFFSWFFFLVFMLLACFLIFTAWVNYSRNGARGCDLLPFSDTLRDLPYILGDWSRKIATTLGGSGTRGGYSAV